MSMSGSSKRLKSYLESILPSGAVEELADAQETVMRMGGAQAGRGRKSDGQKAHAAMQKLAMGQDVTAEEAFLVEAIIIPDKRPAVDILDGDFTVAQADWAHYSEDADLKANILAAIPAVGRVELPDHSSLPYGGTGFLVADNLIMTNRHVAAIFASGLGREGLRFIPGQTAAVDFKRERDSSASQFVRVANIEMIHPYWDMALLKVEGLPAGIEPLTLSMREPEDLAGREIALVGYPAFDPRNDAKVQNQVFGGVYNVKRLLPGLLKTRRAIRSYGFSVRSVTHDASSLGGASGSGVLDVASGEVVALHFAGIYKDANFAVPTYELSRDDHVVGAGVAFGEDGTSNIEDPNPWAVQWADADRGGEAAGIATGQAATAGQVAATAAPGDGVCRWTVPLIVDIRMGAPQPAGQALAAAGIAPAADVERMVEPTHDDNYTDRPGYDRAFVGVDVPMPTATSLDRVSKLDDDTHVLDYYHFSLIVDKHRRLPLITAANVDTHPDSLRPELRPPGAQRLHIEERPGEVVPRSAHPRPASASGQVLQQGPKGLRQRPCGASQRGGLGRNLRRGPARQWRHLSLHQLHAAGEGLQPVDRGRHLGPAGEPRVQAGQDPEALHFRGSGPEGQRSLLLRLRRRRRDPRAHPRGLLEDRRGPARRRAPGLRLQAGAGPVRCGLRVPGHAEMEGADGAARGAGVGAGACELRQLPA